MNVELITSAKLTELLPTSHKLISESADAETMNAFVKEMTEINNRLTAQQTANEQLKKDFEGEKGKVTALEGEKTTLNTKVTELTNEVARLKPFEAKILQIQGKGNNPPNEDVNSRNSGNVTLPEGHPNSLAIAAWKAKNGQA